MKEHTITTYYFEELPEDIQEKIIENNYDINVQDGFWHECVTDELKEAGKYIGIDIDNIYFSGFSSQGDGACFEGNYAYQPKALAKAKEEFPTWSELHDIARDLQDVQKSAFYSLTATVKQRGHYMHEYCTAIDVQRNDDKDVTGDQEELVASILREFMRECYRRLEREYDYLTSREAILKTLKTNDFEYTINGNIF